MFGLRLYEKNDEKVKANRSKNTSFDTITIKTKIDQTILITNMMSPLVTPYEIKISSQRVPNSQYV